MEIDFPNVKMPLFGAGLWLKLLVAVILFVVGMYVQHAFVEPAITLTVQEQIDACHGEQQLLNSEIQQCYFDLQACQSACPGNVVQ